MLIPSISQIRIIVTVNPCNQVDIVNASILIRSEVANIVVTSNRNDRVTFHEYDIGSNESRLTTINTEINVSFILIRKRIFIQNSHLFVESRTINARHQETILIPYIAECSVNISFTSLFVNNVCGKINTFAFADVKCIGLVSKMSFVGSQNLLQLDRKYKDGILTPNRTLGSSLSNIDHQNFAGVNVSLINTGSTVRNQSSVTRNLVDFIPLIYQIVHVVIAKVSSSCNQTAFANSVMINCNGNCNSVTNINIVRIACSNTTIIICDAQSEDIRMILCTKISGQSVIVNGELMFKTINNNSSISYSIGIVHSLVEQTPLIIIIMITGSGECRIINQSNQTNKAVIANNRIASDLNGRIVQNEDIRYDCGVLGLTTMNADCSNTISIRTRSSRHNADSVQVLARNLNTVFIPNIMIGIVSLSNQHSLSS